MAKNKQSICFSGDHGYIPGKSCFQSSAQGWTRFYKRQAVIHSKTPLSINCSQREGLRLIQLGTCVARVYRIKLKTRSDYLRKSSSRFVHTFTFKTFCRGMLSITVIIVGNGISNLSSNLGKGSLHFPLC